MFGHSGHVCPGLCHTLNSNILRMNSSVSFFIVVEGPEQPVSWVKWILSYPSGHTWFPSPRTNQRFTFLPHSKISSCKIVQRTLSRKHCRHCIIRVQSNHTRSRIFRRLKNTMNKRATQFLTINFIPLKYCQDWASSILPVVLSVYHSV